MGPTGTRGESGDLRPRIASHYPPPHRVSASTAYAVAMSASKVALVGESPLAWQVRDQLALLAACSPHVLLLGESGTGKELAAQAIHAMSRAQREEARRAQRRHHPVRPHRRGAVRQRRELPEPRHARAPWPRRRGRRRHALPRRDRRADRPGARADLSRVMRIVSIMNTSLNFAPRAQSHPPRRRTCPSRRA